MIGNVIAPFEGVYIPPFDPDSVFDPTTHIATESDFIKLLENGVYDNKYIGYKVQLGNSVNYNNGIWVIADVNHDSTNTGQENCYDLISQDCINPGVAYGSSSNQWKSSNARTWLNSTFYNGFSNILKNRLINLKYNSQGTWYTDDIVIIPSKVEVNYRATDADNEGVAYPIFTDNASRIKNQFGGSATYWWTRSRYPYDNTNVWIVYDSGYLNTMYYGNSRCLAPILRVS